ncbi:MAG: glycosyltransferase family 4 protein [Hyphomicrobiaceae bacterium]|nr:glycosyltransferase family 4 protein [Hyphomicrobiaceae bacterium]
MPDSLAEVVLAVPGDISTPTGGYAYDRRLIANLPSYGIATRHLELPASYPNPTEADLSASERLLRATPAESRLLIDGLAYGAMPASLIERIDRRIIALVHHPLALETGLDDKRRAELVASERAALALARHVIVTSETTRRTLIADYDVADARITVAEPGTDPAPRASGTGTPMQLLAVGAVSRRKGYDVLIEALAGLKQLDWRLTIAGATDRDAATVKALRAQVQSAGLLDRVNIAGTVVPATLDRFYESADLFILPSRYEGYGMVLAEAMARGLAIICTTGGAAAETVPDAAAIKVPPEDAPALARAISTVIGDNKLRKNMRKASWETGRTLPTWNETARRVAAAMVGIRT